MLECQHLLAKPLMEDQKTPFSDYQWIETDDGSLTLFSKLYQENCHSQAGAHLETQLHYIEGCQIESLYQNLDSFTLLEVGLGTGLGLDLTLQTLARYPLRPAKLISTEIDETLVEFLIKNSPFSFFKSLVKKGNHYFGEEHQIKIIILIGDARRTVPDYFQEQSLKVDAIYQDAFSPRRNPDLWTVEWFKDLQKISSSHVKMSTYSASSSARKSMIEAGWIIQNGPKFGQKRSSTRASLQGVSDQQILDHLGRSPVSAITDASIPNFSQGNSL